MSGVSALAEAAAVGELLADVGAMAREGDVPWSDVVARVRGEVAERGGVAWAEGLSAGWQLWELPGERAVVQLRASCVQSAGPLLVARLAHALPDAARRLAPGGEWTAEMVRPYRSAAGGKLVCTSTVETGDPGLARELARVLREAVG